MKLLYISSKRSKERFPLMKSSIEFCEVKLHLRSSFSRYLKSVANLLRLLLQGRPEVALFEAPGIAALPALLYLKLARIPYCVRLKGNIWQELAEPRGLAYRADIFVGLMAVKYANGILPVSSHLDKVLHSCLRNKLSFVVPIHYSSDLFSLSSTLVHSRLSVHSKPLVLTVTNFNYWGKVKPLVESIPFISHAIKLLGGEWQIIGGGVYLPKVLTMVSDYQYLFTGQISQAKLMELYGQASFLLYISGQDGLPNVLLEAGLFGLPTVINHDSPAAEYVIHGETGFHINLKDKKQVIAVIGKLLRNREQNRQIGLQARAYLQQNFSVENVSSTLEKALRLLLDSHQASPPRLKTQIPRSEWQKPVKE